MRLYIIRHGDYLTVDKIRTAVSGSTEYPGKDRKREGEKKGGFSFGASTGNKDYGETAQRIYLFSTEDEDISTTLPISARILEAQYDPTNGTSSNGDIYIEIPRRGEHE